MSITKVNETEAIVSWTLPGRVGEAQSISLQLYRDNELVEEHPISKSQTSLMISEMYHDTDYTVTILANYKGASGSASFKTQEQDSN